MQRSATPLGAQTGRSMFLHARTTGAQYFNALLAVLLRALFEQNLEFCDCFQIRPVLLDEPVAQITVFWAIPTEILSDSKAAVAVGTINALASLAGFAGPYAFGYLRAETGSFAAGFVVLMFCAIAAGILMLLTPAAQSRGPKSVTSS